MYALLHDASEAYLPDVASPLKPYIVGFKAIENKVSNAIFTRFDMSPVVPPEIKVADIKILYTEMQDNMHSMPDLCLYPDSDITPLDTELKFYGPKEAKEEFLRLFSELEDILKNDVDIGELMLSLIHI